MDSQIIDNSLFGASHPQIIKKINFITVFSAALLIIAGIVAFVVFSHQEDSGTALSTLLMVIGLLFIILGSFLLFSKSKNNVYKPTNSAVQKYSYFFNKEDITDISRALSEEDFAFAKSTRILPNGNARLDIIMSKDAQFAMTQLSEYIPHSYHAVSPVYYFTEDGAVAFSEYLERCKAV